MIIFDLDGTLADCEHRWHFVDKAYLPGCDDWHSIPNHPIDMCQTCKDTWNKWKPDWKLFYEGCDQDKPIDPVIEMWNEQIGFGMTGIHQIWSGRCESVREKTEAWLDDNLLYFEAHQLKMRLIDDNTPLHELKEFWLNDLYEETKWWRRNPVKFVFDSDAASVAMWRRHGIFVFDCNQNGKEL